MTISIPNPPLGREQRRLEISIADLAAIRERRNLVVHNNGLASVEYVAKFDSAVSVGDRVVANAEKAELDRKILSKVATALVSRLVEELC